MIDCVIPNVNEGSKKDLSLRSRQEFLSEPVLSVVEGVEMTVLTLGLACVLVVDPLSTAQIDYQVSEFVDLHLVSRIHKNRRPHLFDDRRTFEPIAWFASAAQINGTVDGLLTVVENHRSLSAFPPVTFPRRRHQRHLIFKSAQR